MEIKLTQKPKNPIIIVGFPGFGLVGTISTEFLIDHLKTESIGRIMFDDMPAMVAIHESKIIDPLGVFYNKKYNVVILHAVSPVAGIEWKLCECLLKIADELKAKEIISLEGVGSAMGEELLTSRVFFYSNNEALKKKFSQINLAPLKEGIIMGVTGALLLKMENYPLSCVFAETHSNMPDSKAAAKVIEALDKYLGLKVDCKPLLEQAQKFEDKLRGLMQKGKEAEEEQEKKKLSYVG